jgi:anti-sigma regulatory factor (Ser/Thr protein kinase)
VLNEQEALSMTAPCDLWLGMPSRADNVALVRQAFGGLADAVGISEPLLADVKTAVSEACNNVVVHAYGGEVGPLEVAVGARGSELTVLVRDHGGGIQPTPALTEQTVHGVGLSLIQALTDKVEFAGAPDSGTEVRMTFSADHDLAVEGENTGASPSAAPTDGLAVSIGQGDLVAPVLGRIIAMLAARAGFSIDRLSDAQLVSDALSAHAPTYLRNGDVRVAFQDADRSLEARVGPLVDGGSDKLLADADLPGIGRLLEQLADEVRTERVNGDGEFLVLRLSETA